MRFPLLLRERCCPFLLAVLFSACLSDVSPSGSDSDDVGSADVLSDVELSALTPRFELEGDSFFRMPWPSDYRIDADGHLELDDFPQAWQTMVGIYIRVIEEEVDGFATMPVVYLGFEGSVGSESIPEPSSTLFATSSVQLLDVSTDGCGQRVPIEVQFKEDGDEFLDANTLVAAPVPGFPLQPSTPYAFVVLRSFGFESGFQTEVPATFAGLLEGSSDNETLSATFAPLRDCLDEASLSVSGIAVATVFTTQDPVVELRALQQMVADPSRVADPEVADWEIAENRSIPGNYLTYTGTYLTPIFQRGTTPYAFSGGGIRFDDTGNPIIQRWEQVPFAITFPDIGTGPFPVLIWSDGTGASLLHYVRGDIAQDALSAGFAIASFQPQFHGDRSGPDADEEEHTFNYINPESGRSVFRQQAADTTYFLRVVRTALDDLSELPELDTDRLVYGGQSQGALVGAILAGVETDIVAYVLNGVGAYLSITVVERKDPVDINAEIQALLGVSEPLDRFHPVVALAQLGSEVVDPINYAPHWTGWSDNPGGSSLFLTNGQNDHTTPERSVNAMTISGVAVPIDPPGWDVDPFGVWDVSAQSLPITQTTTSMGGTPLTIATYLSATTGHYTIYDIDDVRRMAIDFWLSALVDTPSLVE